LLQVVKGYDFNEGINYDKLIDSYSTMGFQATSVSLAINEINKMLIWRLSDEPFNPEIESDGYKTLKSVKTPNAPSFWAILPT